jgi:phosphatidylglycerol---prolipoprotein diacylglyceryl transferase
MSEASLPSPQHALWHLGPVPLRGYALCVLAGILVALAVASRRYRRVGGRRGLILDVATLAVPAGLIGARLYSLATDWPQYFGHGQDWTGIFRLWDGGLGIPGAIAGGAAGAWLACRRAGVALAPVAGAAAPGLAFGQAIGRWGNWFSQSLYGRPVSMPLAVEIAPAHRVRGYENFATFQPAFLYESAWDVLVGLAVIYAARRFLLTGDRIFAVYAGLYAVGGYLVESLRVDAAPHLAGLRFGQWVFAVVFLAAAVYLFLTRGKTGPDELGPPPGPGGGRVGETAGSRPGQPAVS